MTTPSLISMKMSAEEKKDMAEATFDPPEYPWGLSINLDKEQLEKLSFAPTSVGGEVMITAKASVQSISQHKNEKGDDGHVSLQITDMAIDDSSSDDAAEVLFGDS